MEMNNARISIAFYPHRLAVDEYDNAFKSNFIYQNKHAHTDALDTHHTFNFCTRLIHITSPETIVLVDLLCGPVDFKSILLICCDKTHYMFTFIYVNLRTQSEKWAKKNVAQNKNWIEIQHWTIMYVRLSTSSSCYLFELNDKRQRHTTHIKLQNGLNCHLIIFSNSI